MCIRDRANAELSGMKIAYVEIDTLLAKYNFCIDLNEAMVDVYKRQVHRTLP